MGQTAIYGLRWPERTGQAADGPDGCKDLASDVDDQMIRFHTRSTFDGWLTPNIQVDPNQTKVLMNQLVTPTCRGWMIVEYQVNIVGWEGGIFAGWVYGHIGLASEPTQPKVRNQRFHNEIRGSVWYSSGRMAIQTLNLAPIRFHIDLYLDTGSSNFIRVPFLPFSVQHYGGKVT